MAGPLAKKELPAEGCSRRNGKREEGSRHKKSDDDNIIIVMKKEAEQNSLDYNVKVYIFYIYFNPFMFCKVFLMIITIFIIFNFIKRIEWRMLSLQ